MKHNKLILVIISFMLVTGFRLMSKYTWTISENEPTLWIKFCNEDLTGHEEKVQAIIDDINNIETSYIRLALYPSDPDNPDNDPLDTPFTTEKASERTINVCFQKPSSIGAGGQASIQLNDNLDIKSCSIKLIDEVKEYDATEFRAILGHEIGHCLGLDHPQETEKSIMSYFSPESIYTYQDDDKMGLTFLYPKTIEGVDLKESNSYGLSCAMK